jgi:aryl-alcohol dehydrogenase-like predicted oxidoreductase
VTPIAETLAALDELVREGVVDPIGCSNVSVEELEEAEWQPSAEDLAELDRIAPIARP